MDNNGLQVMFKKQGQDLVQIKPTECLMKAAGFEVDQKIDVHYEIDAKRLLLFHKASPDIHSEGKEKTVPNWFVVGDIDPSVWSRLKTFFAKNVELGD